MKAIILVAGYATRLYPLTLNKPKALLPINGKAIIDYIIDEINTIEDVSEIFVVSNHKFAGHFNEWAADNASAKPIKVLDDGTETEDDRRGAIGDIYFTLEQEKVDDDLLVICGDNFFTFKLKEYYDFFINTGKDCICAKELDDIEQLKQFAVARLDSDGRVLDLVEKPAVPRTNIGVYATYFYKKDTVPLFKKYLDEGNNKDAPGYFPQWLYKIKDVYAYIMNGECYDIGTPKAYEEVQELFGK